MDEYNASEPVTEKTENTDEYEFLPESAFTSRIYEPYGLSGARPATEEEMSRISLYYARFTSGNNYLARGTLILVIVIAILFLAGGVFLGVAAGEELFSTIAAIVSLLCILVGFTTWMPPVVDANQRVADVKKGRFKLIPGHIYRVEEKPLDKTNMAGMQGKYICLAWFATETEKLDCPLYTMVDNGECPPVGTVALFMLPDKGAKMANEEYFHLMTPYTLSDDGIKQAKRVGRIMAMPNISF